MKFGRSSTKKGFTLIELSFAIAFISILLITVTLITNEIVSIYRKGYAIKSINQVGRDLIDDFQNSINQSPPTSASAFCEANYKNDSTSLQNCQNNNGFYSIYQQYYSEVKVASGGDAAPAKTVPTGGIFCSGKYTYIWNTGYLFNTDGAYVFSSNSENPQDDLKLEVRYRLAGASTDTTTKNFRLLKVEDASRAICASTIPAKESGASGIGGYPSTNRALVRPGATEGSPYNKTITISGTLATPPEELVNESDSSLALFDLVVFQPARVVSTNRLLFSGSFILATVSGGVDIMASGDYCQAPSYFSADFSYCAINKFNFTIQASGG